jgi:FlaA1/EpsC-like NDP-sugar epimerase
MNLIDKLLNWYFTKNSLPYWCILLLDCFIIYISGIITYWVFHHGVATMINLTPLSLILCVYVLISCVGFRLFRTYSGIVRFSSFVDLKRVALANLVSLIICLFANQIIYKVIFPNAIVQLNDAKIVLIFIIATALMWGIRVIVKLLHDVTTSDKRAKRTLIYGVNEGGVGLAKNIRMQKPVKYYLKGFISHDKGYKHHVLMGEKVYEVNDKLPDIIKSLHIQVVLVSPLRNDEFRNDQGLQDMLILSGVKIMMMENAKEWDAKSGTVNTNSMVEVSVEDLLPREEIEVDMKSVGEQLTNRRILITGSAGSIGSEMVRQIAIYHPAAMMLIDQAETPQHDIRLMMKKDWPDIPCETIVTSICKEKRMEEIFSSFKPDYVFHAAAYKHVPMMEDNPSESIQNNVYGTKIIADLSVKYGVKKFVMVSTDKAVNPTNVMGCSKRICEIYVQALNKKGKTQFVTTRFGNVLGSNGSVIPLFKEQLKKGGPITVTHPDIIRYFMLIPEACKLVLEAGTKGNGGEIFVFDMGKPVKIADLAKRMIKLSGMSNIQIQYTGLREGEKLYEEVLNEKENTKPSFHKKIRIATVREYDYDQIKKEIDELYEISKHYNNMETVKKMKEIVPEYISNNSVYTSLDHKKE